MGVPSEITNARDGEEALDILRGENGQPEMTTPYLILLDVNVPRMNGIEVLHEIREDERLHASVVFMFTTSRDEGDISDAYDLNVAGYLVKRAGSTSFHDVAEMLDAYWRLTDWPPSSAAS